MALSAQKLWQRQHSTGERGLTKDLQAYFADQASRIAETVADFSNPGPADVSQLFDQTSEHEQLIQIVRPHLNQIAAVGIKTELERVATIKTAHFWQKDSADDDFGGLVSFAGEEDSQIDGESEFDYAAGLPDYVVDELDAFVADVLGMAYWEDIQRGTANQLGEVLTSATQDGLSAEEIGQQARTILVGLALARANAIACTETTGALNGGCCIGMANAIALGLLLRKTWYAIRDPVVRSTHLALNETTVGIHDYFNVGGYLAPWAGHWSLPAHERINCRCCVISHQE